MDYDLIVIGGGPAGMMAAGRAAENGARVLLLEKNEKLGRKLLITGGGRCNLTNKELDLRKFTEKFGKSGNFLFSPLSQFGVKDTIKFFNKNGVEIKTERGNRVFPKSDDAHSVLVSLINYLNNNGVDIKTKTEVKSLIGRTSPVRTGENPALPAGRLGGRVEKIILKNNKEINVKNVAICTGGKSHPLTGSTGQAYNWLSKLGHTIIPLRQALAPVLLEENWLKRVEGLSLKNISISVFQNSKKIASSFGEAIFMSNGMSGPIILELSKTIAKLLENSPVSLKIDLKPALDFETLDKRLQKDFKKFSGKMFKNCLGDLLPKALIPIIGGFSGINQEKKVDDITKEERRSLAHLLKELRIEVKRVADFSRAIMTSGGVSLKEIDSKTMKSKIIDNLYLAGEIIDLDGPTGGYNLQLCWSTGFIIGENFKK
ncbi:NAD(P)/FAD-dependent oxidoreductase [bacterium]|nr:MAG: NAD(P)/FAD-dependent oxidoreductase [bacterium]